MALKRGYTRIISLETFFKLKSCNFIKETLTQVFAYEIPEIFKNTFLRNTSGGCFRHMINPSWFLL